MKRALLVMALSAGACSSSPTFPDVPVVWKVDDMHTTPEPEETEYIEHSHYARITAIDPVNHALSLPRDVRAMDINVLDEVPDSSWFENRLGRYELTPSDIANGPGGSPPRLPLIITKGKSTGSNPGFFVKDADGRKFIVKFDIRPEMETGNAAIVSRIFWGLGFYTTSEHIFWFSPDQLTIDPKATTDLTLEEDVPFTQELLDEVLKRSATFKNGKYRALSSELLPGKILGGWPDRGVREGDINDIIPHEHRRTVRALRVIGAWLEHSDINVRNTLDSHVEENGRKFVRHYMQDFGETLGAHGVDHPWIGHQYLFDYEIQFGSLLTFGLWTRPWEEVPQRPFQSVGAYVADIDPRAWKEKKPYYPFRYLTDADAFWAAKIIMRFTREHIQACVERARLSDPAAAGYLIDTMYNRRRSIGLAYMNNVTAVDRFSVTRDGLCMVDLSVHHQLAMGGIVELLVDGEVTARERIASDGKVCFPNAADEDYVRYEIRTFRGTETLPSIQVHVRGGATPRIAGVIRDF